MSAIACMTINGILDVKTHKETSNGDIFYDFIHTHLIPHLCPFDEHSSRSVVVLDNCSIHQCVEVVASLRDTYWRYGALSSPILPGFESD